MKEIMSKIFALEDVEPILKKIIEVLVNNNIQIVDIMFGFAWGNYIYENNWDNMTIHASEIIARTYEYKEYGNIGDDDLYINIPDSNIEILICHERDIHIRYEQDSELLSKLKRVLPEEQWVVRRDIKS
ncbi:MAG: hypothetical protein ACM34K_14705 [Bacillota bacterium]